MRIDLVDPQCVLMAEIADRTTTRDDIAITYAFAIRQQDEVDFAEVNRAIIHRWSVAGLKYVKAQAWKRVEGRA